MAKDMQNRSKQSAAIFNRPFQEKLGNMFPRNTQQKQQVTLPNLYYIGQDGVDHINVWFNAETELGHALHQNAKYRFNHSLFGPFLTVEGFYRWLSSENGDDEFRVLNGIQCSHHAKKTVNRGYVPNLRYLMVDATWQKVKAYPDMLKELGESTLPFDSYYYVFDEVNGERVSTRTRYKNAPWIVQGLNIMREAIKNGTEPNFDILFDDKAEYEKMVETVKKAAMPVKVAKQLEPKAVIAEEPAKPKVIPNPPGTGKKALAKARRLAREAAAAKEATSQEQSSEASCIKIKNNAISGAHVSESSIKIKSHEQQVADLKFAIEECSAALNESAGEDSNIVGDLHVLYTKLLMTDMNYFMSLPQEGIVKEVYDDYLAQKLHAIVMTDTPVIMKPTSSDFGAIEGTIVDASVQSSNEAIYEAPTAQADVPDTINFGSFFARLDSDGVFPDLKTGEENDGQDPEPPAESDSSEEESH